MAKSKQDELHQAVMKSLDSLEAKVDRLRTEDIPGIYTRLAVFETQIITVKEEVSKEAKRDAKIYSGIGSAIVTAVAVAAAWLRN